MGNAVVPAVIWAGGELRSTHVALEAKCKLQTIRIARTTNETGVRVCAQFTHLLRAKAKEAHDPAAIEDVPEGAVIQLVRNARFNFFMQSR